MIAFLLLVLLHIILFGVAVFAAKLAENRYIIDDSDMAIMVAIFIPLGVFVWLGAMWLADQADDYLDEKEDRRRHR